MDASAQTRETVIDVVFATELKVAVKRFVVMNLCRQLAKNNPADSVANLISSLLISLTNEALGEVVSSLMVIQAMNEKADKEGEIDA